MPETSFIPTSPAVRKRALDLHYDSFVFDYLPLEPFVMSPAMQAAMESKLEDSTDPGVVLRAMADRRNVELERDPAVRDKVGKAWRVSGVNGFQCTLGAYDLAHKWDGLLRDAAHWRRRAAAGGDMEVCTTACELLQAHSENKVGVLFGTQDCAQIGDDLDRLTWCYDAGVRVMQLTYNTRNLIGEGCMEPTQAGLSRFGIQVVKRMNELGIIVDVAHCGSGTTIDAIRHSERPIAITHSSCAAIVPHPRAKTDEQLHMLAERDGYLGIDTVPFFIAPKGHACTLDTLADHIEHAVKILGPQRVGIGTDWGAWTPDFPVELKAATHRKLALGHGATKREIPDFTDEIKVVGFGQWEDWPNITIKLVERGFDDVLIRGLLGGNWISFLQRSGL